MYSYPLLLLLVFCITVSARSTKHDEELLLKVLPESKDNSSCNMSSTSHSSLKDNEEYFTVEFSDDQKPTKHSKKSKRDRGQKHKFTYDEDSKEKLYPSTYSKGVKDIDNIGFCPYGQDKTHSNVHIIPIQQAGCCPSNFPMPSAPYDYFKPKAPLPPPPMAHSRVDFPPIPRPQYQLPLPQTIQHPSPPFPALPSPVTSPVPSQEPQKVPSPSPQPPSPQPPAPPAPSITPAPPPPQPQKLPSPQPPVPPIPSISSAPPSPQPSTTPVPPTPSKPNKQITLKPGKQSTNASNSKNQSSSNSSNHTGSGGTDGGSSLNITTGVNSTNGSSSHTGATGGSSASSNTTGGSSTSSNITGGSSTSSNTTSVGGSGGGVSTTEQEFYTAVTTCGYPQPSSEKYKSFIQGISKSGISSKRELAMFLSNILHESDGLQAKAEIQCLTDGCKGQYDAASDGTVYYGRGYTQLTWKANYAAASKELYGDENKLLSNPNIVATDENVAWDTAFWYWKTRVHTAPGVTEGKFGATTKAINGALECGGGPNPKAQRRFEMYTKILKVFGINEAPIESGCYN